MNRVGWRVWRDNGVLDLAHYGTHSDGSRGYFACVGSVPNTRLRPAGGDARCMRCERWAKENAKS